MAKKLVFSTDLNLVANIMKLRFVENLYDSDFSLNCFQRDISDYVGGKLDNIRVGVTFNCSKRRHRVCYLSLNFLSNFVGISKSLEIQYTTKFLDSCDQVLSS